MLKKIFFSTFLFFSAQSIASTPLTSKEIGLFLGESYYLGELNLMHFVPFNFGAGAFYRYNYDDRLSLRTQFNYGKIEGTDANSNNSFNQLRNLSFTNQIFELNALGEFNFLPFSHLSPKSRKITPYTFIGLNLFYHNPSVSASEDGKIKKIQAALPMGFGIKYGSGKFGMSLEWGIRKTFTDYLDGVSTYHTGNDRLISNFQRGEVFNKDWYVFTGLTLFVNLTQKRSCPN